MPWNGYKKGIEKQATDLVTLLGTNAGGTQYVFYIRSTCKN